MRLTEIHIYPVKSLAGIALQRASLDAMGLRHDRRWMLVDPVRRMWAGERDAAALTAGLDANSAALVRRVLELIED